MNMYKSYDNNPMNKFNEFMKYKGHLERLYLSKSIINNKCPIIPSFFRKKRKDIENENNLKLYSENHSLLNRIIRIVRAGSKYSPSKCVTTKCPAFERKDKILLKKIKNINEKNQTFYKAIKKSKSTLDINKSERDYFNSRYYKNNICKNKSTSNPNLKFVTFQEFNKKCNKIIKQKIINDKKSGKGRLKYRTVDNYSIRIKIKINNPYFARKRCSSTGY